MATKNADDRIMSTISNDKIFSFQKLSVLKFSQCFRSLKNISGQRNKELKFGKFQLDRMASDKENAHKHIFVSHTNPVTGKMDWIVQDENYDYVQEIARYVIALYYHHDGCT